MLRKKLWFHILVSIFILDFLPLVAEEVVSAKDRNSTISIMKKVCDWQLAHPRHREVEWPNGVLYTGIMALYDVIKDEKYLNVLLSVGERNNWEPGPRPRHADDHCVGQVYLELYFLKGDPRMLVLIQKRFDLMMVTPKRGREEWWWCDALFMAPPVLTRLFAATGEEKYLDFMDTMWWDTTELLYDRNEHLYFRDELFVVKEGISGLRDKNGKKLFWSRGNGWVMAGLVRTLQFMPRDYPSRDRYIVLFQKMAEKIASLQCEDGLWRPSLLDPNLYPVGETSGTGLFCYAIAWGINEGILSREKYFSTVDKAWRALVRAVHASGKIGWVQKIGFRPGPVCRDDTEVYGTGAFLLAGTEILKLLERR